VSWCAANRKKPPLLLVRYDQLELKPKSQSNPSFWISSPGSHSMINWLDCLNEISEIFSPHTRHSCFRTPLVSLGFTKVKSVFQKFVLQKSVLKLVLFHYFFGTISSSQDIFASLSAMCTIDNVYLTVCKAYLEKESFLWLKWVLRVFRAPDIETLVLRNGMELKRNRKISDFFGYKSWSCWSCICMLTTHNMYILRSHPPLFPNRKRCPEKIEI
jgi:hypothetical protein